MKEEIDMKEEIKDQLVSALWYAIESGELTIDEIRGILEEELSGIIVFSVGD